MCAVNLMNYKCMYCDFLYLNCNELIQSVAIR